MMVGQSGDEVNIHLDDGCASTVFATSEAITDILVFQYDSVCPILTTIELLIQKIVAKPTTAPKRFSRTRVHAHDIPHNDGP